MAASNIDTTRAIAKMDLNSDKSKTLLVRTSEQAWLETPSGGVFRRPIERQGDENARCTTVVKFLPNKNFPEHAHTGGEEFFVTDGAWADHFGASFPKYSYIRNYIGSRHSPLIGEDGVRILVKLRQMHEDCPEPNHKAWFAPPPTDTERKDAVEGSTDEETADWRKVGAEGGNSYFRRVLYTSKNETVAVEYYPEGVADFEVAVPENGKEVFVVDGTFTDELGEHDADSWARYANSSRTYKCSKPAGEALYLYVKSGHLQSPEVGTRGI